MKFDREQDSFKVGEIEMGGQPGELPTVLIGTIFYDGHKVVLDKKTGKIDTRKAESLIRDQENMSEKTKVPHMVDIVASTVKAIERYIDFVVDTTNAPLLVDSTLPDVRLAGAKHAIEIGLKDRLVYNSITYHIKEDEVSSLKDMGVKTAIALAYHPRSVYPKGRIDLLEGSEQSRGLLQITGDVGIDNVMVDTAVLDVPSIGFASDAVSLVKKELGLIAGGGPSNAVLEWQKVRELGTKAKNVCIASATAALQHAGADFLLYGPIGKAGVVFPSVAMIDAIVAYSARLDGIRPRSKEHPLFTIF